MSSDLPPIGLSPLRGDTQLNKMEVEENETIAKIKKAWVLRKQVSDVCLNLAITVIITSGFMGVPLIFNGIFTPGLIALAITVASIGLTILFKKLGDNAYAIDLLRIEECKKRLDEINEAKIQAALEKNKEKQIRREEEANAKDKKRNSQIEKMNKERVEEMNKKREVQHESEHLHQILASKMEFLKSCAELKLKIENNQDPNLWNNYAQEIENLNEPFEKLIELQKSSPQYKEDLKIKEFFESVRITLKNMQKKLNPTE